MYFWFAYAKWRRHIQSFQKLQFLDGNVFGGVAGPKLHWIQRIQQFQLFRLRCITHLGSERYEEPVGYCFRARQEMQNHEKETEPLKNQNIAN